MREIRRRDGLLEETRESESSHLTSRGPLDVIVDGSELTRIM